LTNNYICVYNTNIKYIQIVTHIVTHKNTKPLSKLANNLPAEVNRRKDKQMKRFFLIDVENVGKSFLQGIEKLKISDVLIVYHNQIARSEFSQTILAGLQKTKAVVKKFYIENASKNAMDFQIMMQLGYLMAQNGSSAEYYIVSNDRGFDVATFTTNNNIHAKVRRIVNLEANFEEEERIQQMKDVLKRLLPEYSKNVIKTVQQGIDASKNTNDLHNFLQSHLRRDFTNIYPRVKYLVESRG